MPAKDTITDLVSLTPMNYILMSTVISDIMEKVQITMLALIMNFGE